MATAKTTGIVVVAALAMTATRDPPEATRTATGRLTRSAANFGSRSIVLAPRIFDRDVLVLDEADILQALEKPGESFEKESGDDLGSRNPITGMAGRCARAASGHAAAAPPSSLISSRRLM